ncbi:MAG: hypothetical protein ACRDMV_01460 [Streptosporangiales bacterium]
MALGMLADMPWYHYALMALVVLGLAIVVHLRIRRKYWPQHASMRGIARSTVEHAVILAVVEAVAIVVVVGGVSGGMVAYHMTQLAA